MTAIDTASTVAHKHLVTRYYAEVWNRQAPEALDRFVAADYVQHNPAVANGREPLRQFLNGVFGQLPAARFEVVRLAADGDLVFAHCLFKAHPEDRGTAVVDIYRIADGLLAEHWDVKEAVPEHSANGNAMV